MSGRDEEVGRQLADYASGNIERYQPGSWRGKARSTARDRSSWRRATHKIDPHCAYCGNITSLDRSAGWLFATVDHVQPLARGGLDRESNYALACRACNEAKGRAHTVTAEMRRKLIRDRPAPDATT